MKDNISTSVTLNRKIVIEFRFNPRPKILDLKGTIIDAIDRLSIFPTLHWEIGDAALSIKDDPNNALFRNQILIDLNRFAFISTKIDSVESFYSKFQKIYSELKDIIDIKAISRIGCRIQGTYNVKSKEFDSILNNFKESFPNQIFLEDYPSTDLMFRLNYQNGMYIIGPINKNDDFLKKEFPFQDRNNNIGIGIDTDNYLIDTDSNGINPTKVKDVVTATLAVEKSLYEKMKDF